MRQPVYRNEWKYYISLWEGELLKRRLLPFMERDAHAEGGQYTIRSLYFDDYWDSAYEEKIMGVVDRQKWRIRIYNYSDSSIKLERRKSGAVTFIKIPHPLQKRNTERYWKGITNFSFPVNSLYAGNFTMSVQ